MAFFLGKPLQLCRLGAFPSRPISSYAAPLILSPAQVHDLSRSGNEVSILDASWFMPNSARRPHNEFTNKRIPGAGFLDLDEVASSHELGLKHMMPEEHVFAEACGKLGIESSSHVVIYDSMGIFSSPRALFMFRSFGHQKSSIINGGLPAWIVGGFPIEGGPLFPPKKTRYPMPNLDTNSVRSAVPQFKDISIRAYCTHPGYEQIVSNSVLDPSTGRDVELVLDARAPGRYLGTEPEPRPGISSGHIPHSFSLPFHTFLQKHSGPNSVEYTSFLSYPDLRKALVASVGPGHAESIIRGEAPVVTSCGSGMTAGVLWLGLKLLGVENISLYDESWTGYAMRQASKIEKSH